MNRVSRVVRRRLVPNVGIWQFLMILCAADTACRRSLAAISYLLHVGKYAWVPLTGLELWLIIMLAIASFLMVWLWMTEPLGTSDTISR